MRPRIHHLAKAPLSTTLFSGLALEENPISRLSLSRICAFSPHSVSFPLFRSFLSPFIFLSRHSFHRLLLERRRGRRRRKKRRREKNSLVDARNKYRPGGRRAGGQMQLDSRCRGQLSRKPSAVTAVRENLRSLNAFSLRSRTNAPTRPLDIWDPLLFHARSPEGLAVKVTQGQGRDAITRQPSYASSREAELLETANYSPSLSEGD